MKKVVALLLLICGSVSFAVAQSGRKARVEAPPVSSPSAKTEDPSVYSESASRTKQPSMIPSIRGVNDRRPASKVSSPPAATTPTPSAAEQIAGEDDDVLRVETNLVMVPVSVFDRNGLYIPSLRQEDFKIFENGKEQQIEYFGTTDQPFTVVLLLDTSPSTEYKIDEIQRAAITFVNQLKPQDRVMVIEFDQNIHVLAEPTSDRNTLYNAIRRADFGGGTSLYDTVDFALRQRLNRIEGKKAIVLFTDGVDTTSHKAGYDSTLRIAEEADAQIFPIYYNTYKDPFSNSGGVMSSPIPPIMSSPFPFPGSSGQQQRPRGTSRRDYELGKKYLDELALRTAGQVFPADSTSGGLEGAFAGIAEALRRQYSIGYSPAEAGQSGQRKQIKVRVSRPNLVVRARDSYIVGAAPEAPKTAISPKKLTE
ncbi:MAG TPA: VWA domain-containing protein [Pyrinomonadaceae bacterium]|nr:VWA domain-containing protein [Pyrinomonadaceae bacterium]